MNNLVIMYDRTIDLEDKDILKRKKYIELKEVSENNKE